MGYVVRRGLCADCAFFESTTTEGDAVEVGQTGETFVIDSEVDGAPVCIRCEGCRMADKQVDALEAGDDAEAERLGRLVSALAALEKR